MKKFVPVIMCVLLLSLCGCKKSADEYFSEINGFFNSKEYSEIYEDISKSAQDVKNNIVSYVKKAITKENYGITIKPVPVSLNNEEYSAYKSLTENQKNLYSIISTAVSDMELRQIDITKYSTGDVFSEVVVAHRAVMCDRPDLFWMPKTFSVLSVEGSDSKYLCFKDIYNTSSDTGFYKITKPQKEKMQASLDSITNTIMENVNSMTDDFYKELYIHDYICRNVTYDEEAAKELNNADMNTLSVYGALVEGKAVCEGYSKAVQYLCNKAGIPCSVVYGEYETVPHMWNIINIGGEDYYLDATFDDSSEITVLHTYFNVTKTDILNDHIFDSVFSSASVYDSTDSFNFLCPDCENTAMNFFEKTGAYITNDCALAVKVLLSANEEGKTCAEIKNNTALSSDRAFLLLKSVCRKQLKLKSYYRMNNNNTLVVTW